jgi:hypothetical protein
MLGSGVGNRVTIRLMIGAGVGSKMRSMWRLGGETLQQLVLEGEFSTEILILQHERGFELLFFHDLIILDKFLKRIHMIFLSSKLITLAEKVLWDLTIISDGERVKWFFLWELQQLIFSV